MKLFRMFSMEKRVVARSTRARSILMSVDPAGDAGSTTGEDFGVPGTPDTSESQYFRAGSFSSSPSVTLALPFPSSKVLGWVASVKGVD